jgi:hypothetical protein
MMKRKGFLKFLSLTALGGFLTGCGITDSNSRSGGGRQDEAPEKRYAKKFKDAMPEISKAAQNGDSYEISENGNTFSFAVIPAGEGYVHHPHVRITRSDGEIAYLVWGFEGLYPSLKLLDATGEDMMEVSLNEFSDNKDSSRNWLETALVVVAVLFAAWLGLEVVGLFISLAASIALFLLALAILFVGVAVIGGLIKTVFEKTKWDEELFERLGNDVPWLEAQFRRLARM